MALVKKLVPVVARINKETGISNYPSDPRKVYLILLFLDDETRTFELVTSREEAFDVCLEHVKDCDLGKSQIMTHKHTLEDSISIYSFMRGCLEKYKELAMKTDLSKEDLDDYLVQDGYSPEGLYKEDGME